MLTASPLLKIKHFFQFKVKNHFHIEQCLRKNNKNELFWLGRSCVSLQMISDSFKTQFKRAPCFLIPSFICIDVTEALEECGANISYYEIDDKLNPKIESIDKTLGEREVDFLLCVNYFGIAIDLKKIKKKFKGLTIIEDSTHVVVPHGTIGVHSDISIYSPYKHFPIPNGAALVISKEYLNKNQELKKILSSIKKVWAIDIMWNLKKILQKIFLISSRKNHLDFLEDPPHFKSEKKSISQRSLSILSTYSEKEIDEILCIRKRNISLWKDILKYLNIKMKALPEAQSHLVLLGNEESAISLYRTLKKIGGHPSTWPTLPNHSILAARKQRNSLVLLPIHQDLHPVDFYKILKKSNILKNNDDYEFDQCEKEKWSEFVENSDQATLPQSFSYIEAKNDAETSISKNLLIKLNKKVVGICSIRYKKIFLFNIPYINRGPILIEENIVKMISVIKAIKKSQSPCLPMVISPNILKKPLSCLLLRKSGWLNLPGVGEHSSVIDLNKEVDEIRNSLNSKWRNLLKKSESFDLDVKISSDKSDYIKVIKEYEKFKNEKGFKGISFEILDKYYDYCQPRNRPITLTIYKEDQVISAVVLARLGRRSIYLIGLNNEDGREVCGNYLLLWKSIIELKKRGLSFLDLGGFDEKNNANVTHFKKQLNGDEYRLVGNYLVL